MKAYKGFNKDMTCRGFQYEEGKTYVTDRAELCECGFHACENPIDCFRFYDPGNSVYHEVEVEDIVNGKNKLVAKKITIGKELTIKELVEAQIAQKEANNAIGYRSINSTTEDCSANSTIGNYSSNITTGDESANNATGYRSTNSTTGVLSANSTTGNCSVNSATGCYSANSTTGDCSANSATGHHSANSAMGYGSANVSTGNGSTNFGANGTISVGWGRDNKCSGKIGAFLVLCEREEWDGSKYPLIGKPVLIEIDGEQYKEDTWYVLRNGKVVEYDSY